MDLTGFGGQATGCTSWAWVDAATTTQAPMAATDFIIECRRMTILLRGIFHLYRSSGSAECDENLGNGW
jgi:hypothetical protein